MIVHVSMSTMKMIEFTNETKADLFDVCANCCQEGYVAGIPKDEYLWEYVEEIIKIINKQDT